MDQRHIIFAVASCLCACAEIPRPYEDTPYQREAIRAVAAYNASHGTQVPVPHVYLWEPVAPLKGDTLCRQDKEGRYISCDVYISPTVAQQEPDYALTNTTRHEVAHAICAMAVPGCTPDDHGYRWQSVAVEIGFPRTDPYITVTELR